MTTLEAKADERGVGALDRRRLAAALDAALPAAEADRMRAALLAAVSHDLRSPLAAAKAAVSCLRSRDVELTAADRDDLLATADESLDLLARLAASLLGETRLQAGARSVFPRPADLEEIIGCSLRTLGPPAQAVMISIAPELPGVMADPPIMERVIANVTANALRYSPAGSPPLLTASADGDRVELRVVDRGPGVPEADRDRMFVPFQRLGEPDSTTGVGLGLAMSRGLIEAMRGTLEPQETPGGGLTMTISIPAASRSAHSPASDATPHGAGATSHPAQDRLAFSGAMTPQKPKDFRHLPPSPTQIRKCRAGERVAQV
jgi:two-component system sensor histidine kinase KdpD